MLKDMKLGRKFTAAFLAVAALCVLVGGVALIGVHSTNTASQALSDDQLPSLIGLGWMNTGISELRRLELRMMMLKEHKEDAAYQQTVADLRKTWTDALEHGRAIFEPLPRTAEEDQQWQGTVRE